MKKIFLLVTLAMSVVSAKAFAADGSSGCGPGWYLFTENSLVSSSLRATTNGILSPAVTIGMTMGTSKCSKHTIVKTEKESLYFATMNYHELKSDMARGDGEHLAAFAQTIGCKASAQPAFNRALQSGYNNVVPAGQENPEALMLEVYKVILTNPSLFEQCSVG